MCPPPTLLWLWAAGYNRHYLQHVSGLRDPAGSTSVGKYRSGRAQPFGMRKRKINATSPLRATGTLLLIALHNGFSKPLIIRLYFRKLQIKKLMKLSLKGTGVHNEAIALCQHQRSKLYSRY